MNETVYLLGAGVNQTLKDFDNLSPPLISNLFQLALAKREYSNEFYTHRIQIVYDYIGKYRKKPDLIYLKHPLTLNNVLLCSSAKKMKPLKGTSRNTRN